MVTIDENIYSGKLCTGVMIDSFEYADYEDGLTEINAFLTNDWAVTKAGVTGDNIVPFKSSGRKMGGRGLKALRLQVQNEGTLTRTLPDYNKFLNTESSARYLCVRCAKEKDAGASLDIRPILINDAGTEEYCAANNPKAPGETMTLLMWKIGGSEAENTDFDVDRDQYGDQEPASAGVHKDYDEWGVNDQIKKIALRFESNGTPYVYIDEIFIIDIDEYKTVLFHYDDISINAGFDYYEADISGGHGENRYPRKSTSLMITLIGVLVDDINSALGSFWELNQTFSVSLALLAGSYPEQRIYLYLDDHILPVDILALGKSYNRLSHGMEKLNMTFAENNTMVVLD